MRLNAARPPQKKTEPSHHTHHPCLVPTAASQALCSSHRSCSLCGPWGRGPGHNTKGARPASLLGGGWPLVLYQPSTRKSQTRPNHMICYVMLLRFGLRFCMVYHVDSQNVDKYYCLSALQLEVRFEARCQDPQAHKKHCLCYLIA